jgi:hypothetical protein
MSRWHRQQLAEQCCCRDEVRAKCYGCRCPNGAQALEYDRRFANTTDNINFRIPVVTVYCAHVCEAVVMVNNRLVDLERLNILPEYRYRFGFLNIDSLTNFCSSPFEGRGDSLQF